MFTPYGAGTLTSRWLPGEVVRDDYLLPNQPAYDGLTILVYRRTDGGV